jgi:hypothetical protein
VPRAGTGADQERGRAEAAMRHHPRYYALCREEWYNMFYGWRSRRELEHALHDDIRGRMGPDQLRRMRDLTPEEHRRALRRHPMGCRRSP